MRDPEFRLTQDELAEIYLNHSGLDQREKKDVFKKAGGEWEPDKIRAEILKTHDQAHELDEGRVQKGRFFSRHPDKHQVRFVAHRPQDCV